MLRKRATMISLDVAPNFYALSENYGEPGKDYLLQYQEGRLTWEAKTVYETILNEGALDTISLRKLARMTAKTSDSPFNRALETLQADFKILPVGIAQAGVWKYAFIYECVHRHYPDLVDRPAPSARPKRGGGWSSSTCARWARPVCVDISLLFGWSAQEIAQSVGALVQAGVVQQGVAVVELPGEWVVLAELMVSSFANRGFTPRTWPNSEESTPPDRVWLVCAIYLVMVDCICCPRYIVRACSISDSLLKSDSHRSCCHDHESPFHLGRDYPGCLPVGYTYRRSHQQRDDHPD